MWAQAASGDKGALAPFDFTEYRARFRGGGAEAKDGARTDVCGRRPAEDGYPSRAGARPRRDGKRSLRSSTWFLAASPSSRGFLIVWGAISLGLAIRENQGGPQLATAISAIAGCAIIVAAAVNFGMLDTSWPPRLGAPMLTAPVHKGIGEHTEKAVGKLSARMFACVAGGIASCGPHCAVVVASAVPCQPVACSWRSAFRTCSCRGMRRSR